MPVDSQQANQLNPAADGAKMAAMTAIPAAQNGEREPRFDVDVPSGGYRWWYIDGISPDGRNSIVIIAFIGSVFSPYYFRARARGADDPFDHCSINVGLYRPRGKLWAMTERGHNSLDRGKDLFKVGPSQLRWYGDRLEIELRERSTPFARPIRGTVIVRPHGVNEQAFTLDAGGRHRWQPFAPTASIEVDMRSPGLRWKGEGYLDTNAGERALEDDFRSWNWSRSHSSQHASIRYVVIPRAGDQRFLSVDFDSGGAITESTLPPASVLPASGWRIARTAHTDTSPIVMRTLEDTPFYARSLLGAGRADESHCLLMHESLDLERFKSPWVQFLLPFRMPRVTRRAT